MLPPESQLNYPWGDALPPLGATHEIAPGIRWLRMGLPFALDHINLWLVRDHCDGRDGWAVIDCGIDSLETRTHWESIFAEALDGLPILRVFVTHMHPDHIGLAHWLCNRWNAPMAISATDYYVAHAACSGQDGVSAGGAEALRFFHTHGFGDADTAQKLLARRGYYRQLVPAVPHSFRRLQDGLLIQIGGLQWQCISGFGHAPEHIALYCASAGVLIAGDMLLPRISTNVSVYSDEPEANALQQFLDSIDRFAPLPADTLVLPSHGRPFVGAHTRIAQLHAHHRTQLDALLAFCAEAPRCAADAIPILFKRKLDFHQLTFALGEAIAHLHALWHTGKVVRSQDAHGVLRFHTV
jgi:glyoxylase-like metal-dependent hydrolase (beta-lactamase superfamily II)